MRTMGDPQTAVKTLPALTWFFQAVARGTSCTMLPAGTAVMAVTVRMIYSYYPYLLGYYSLIPS